VRAIALLALIVGVHAEAGDFRSGAADFTPFQLTQAGGIAVPAMLNGAGPFLLLLDTGSSHSAISEDLARRIAAPTVARTVVASPLGEDTRTVVRIDRLELGPLFASGVFPSVLRRKAIDETGRIQGLIGQDVLAFRRYTIDFQLRGLVWHWNPVEPGGRPAFGLEFEEGRFLVALPQSGTTLRLVPDSGTARLVLFHSGERELRDRGLALPGRDSVELATLTGRRNVQQIVLPVFRVGPLILDHVPAVLVDRAEASRSAGWPAVGNGAGWPAVGTGAGDGLLPVQLFDRVTFDGPQRLLVLEKGVGRVTKHGVADLMFFG
jgi:hypothetical protein